MSRSAQNIKYNNRIKSKNEQIKYIRERITNISLKRLVKHNK